MSNNFRLGLIGVLLFLGGCASYSANIAENDEQVDLYLATLDDKYFVWCTLDLVQCRKDFEKWKLTPRGRTIIREFEKEDTGQTNNMHQVPNTFRTRFVDENQLEEEMGELAVGQGDGQDSEAFEKTFSRIGQHDDIPENGIHVSPKIYGPEAPSHYKTDTEGHGSP